MGGGATKHLDPSDVVPVLQKTFQSMDLKQDNALGIDDFLSGMDELISETRSESSEMFGESADNITAICVSFDTIVPGDSPA